MKRLSLLSHRAAEHERTMMIVRRPAVLARSWRRLSSTLRLLRPRGEASDGRPTVYVTGFLTDTSCSQNWGDWLRSHQQLANAQDSLGWCEEAYGLDWRTGASGDWLGRWPLPLHVAVLLMQRSSPAALVAGAAGDTLLNAARLYLTFRAAEEAAARDAPKVAAALRSLSATEHVHSYRVVAHSLGCRLIVDALPLLPPESRPAEVHLCAAALTASHAQPNLHALTQPGGALYHHWSSLDEALSSGFLLASRGEAALGSAPLPPWLPSDARDPATGEDSSLDGERESFGMGTVVSHDASGYLGVASHSAYRLHFHRLAADGTNHASLSQPFERVTEVDLSLCPRAAFARSHSRPPAAAAAGVARSPTGSRRRTHRPRTQAPPCGSRAIDLHSNVANDVERLACAPRRAHLATITPGNVA